MSFIKFDLKEEFYTKEEINELIEDVSGLSNVYTKSEVDALIGDAIRTINGDEEEEEEDMYTTYLCYIVWDDDDNQDGNRPNSVDVNLFREGVLVDTVTITQADGWRHTFEIERNITYSINSNPFSFYTSEVHGGIITFHYTPETTNVSVQVVWNDSNNLSGLRPSNVYLTLSNGADVLLNESNGWSATISNLPTMLNQQPANYSWVTPEVTGYNVSEVTSNNDTTAFTLTLTRPERPPAEGKK